METAKETSKRVKRIKHPIVEAEVVAATQPIQQETPPQTPPQEKPLFTSNNEEPYRNLLLERPAVPVLTNMQEAVVFIGLYEKWNRKVQLTFK